MIKKDKEPVIFTSAAQVFAEEDRKLAELKKSDAIEDKIAAILMEAHIDDPDKFGLFYAFAKVKADAIMKAFHVTNKSSEPAQAAI